MRRWAVLCVGACLVYSPTAASSRLTAVVSDLHLDEHHRNEALVPFLDAIQDRAPEGIHLVFNGDTFEIGGGSESDALSRLETILDAHPGLVGALRRLAEANDVVFVAGHADAALLFSAVAARLRERLGIAVATKGFWVSEDGRIVAEHGHQLPGDAYRFEDWPRPFVSDRLAASWGMRHLDPRMAELGRRFPLLDVFAPPLAGLQYGLSADADAEVSPELMKRFLLTVSWQQFRRDLELEVEAPAWDLKAIRGIGDAFVLQSVLEDDPLYHRWQRAGLSASELTDEEILLVCDYRAAVRRARRRMERGLTQLARVGPVPAECPRLEGTHGPSFSYYWSSRDRRYQRHLAALPPSPDVLVHGHTHLRDRGFVPRGEGTMPRIVNGGAFKRVLTPAAFESMKASRNEDTEELLATLTPEDLSPCYSLVLVEAYDDAPTPVLWYWSPESDGDHSSWTFSRRCEQDDRP